MANPSPSSILVLGAGELGTAVLSSIAKHPSLKSSTKVSVLLRQSTITTGDVSKRQELDRLRNLGVNFLAGDINEEDEQTLSAKFATFEVIIGCTGMSSPAGIQLKLARAVLAGGVKCYIPWQFGVKYDIIGRESSQDLFTEQLSVRDMLHSQNETSWIIVSTGIFMSFLFEDFFGVVSADRGTVRALGSWENGVTVTDVMDIGKMVAEIVLLETDIGHQVVYIAGDTVSYGTLADVVGEIRGKDVHRELWTVEKLKDDLAQDPENGVKKYRVVFAEGKGVSWAMDQTLNHEKNIRLQSVRDWLLHRL
jgi:hypothetical protein